MSSRSYTLLGLWPIINKWKKLVYIAAGLAFLISLVVVMFLPNIYRSAAIFYPTNPETTDPDRIVTEGGRLQLGGRTEDLDRIITIGQSQPIAEQIIRRFDLYKHYDSGTPGSDKADQEVLDAFTEHLSIVHNNRDAIELTFEDSDKKLAASIANTMVHIIDSVNQQLTYENRQSIINLYKGRTDFLEKEYKQIQDSILVGRRRYGVYGLERETRYLGRAIIEIETKLRQAEGEGDTRKAAGLRRALQGLTRADGGNIINLENYIAGNEKMSTLLNRFQDVQGRLTTARGVYESARVALTSGRISSIYVVQKAYPATRKFKPFRSLIVTSSVFITFILSIIFVTLLELYRGNLSLGRLRETNV